MAKNLIPKKCFQEIEYYSFSVMASMAWIIHMYMRDDYISCWISFGANTQFEIYCVSWEIFILIMKLKQTK